MSKKTLATWKRALLFFIQQLIAAVAAVFIAVIAISSTVKVPYRGEPNSYGQYRGSQKYFISPLEYDESFEESDIFLSLLYDGISDIIRMSVIKSQLETDGEFNGDKVIDVTAYANRAEELSGLYVTASYRLEDLLKWGKYGREYTGKMFESEEEMRQFLALQTNYTVYEGTYTTGFHGPQDSGRIIDYNLYTTKNKIETAMEEAAKNAALQGDSAADSDEEYAIVTETSPSQESAESELYQTILTNRYLTVTGEKPEDLVSSWDEYYELCQNIDAAASSLYYNYNEYQKYSGDYDRKNTNLFYCMEMMVNGEKMYFSNVEDSLAALDEKSVNNFFSQFETKIYYSPYDMKYVTNTNVEEDYFLSLMNAYNYAYTENTKIWIAVDTAFTADDIFARANYCFTKFLPFWWQYVGFTAFLLILYVVILVVYSMFTGRGQEEGAAGMTALNWFDRLPLEIVAFITGIFAIASYLMVLFTWDYLGTYDYSDMEIIRAACVETLIVSCAFCSLFYSFIRRCRARALLRNSFAFRILQFIYRKLLVKLFSGFRLIYRNFPVAVGTILPYCVFLAMNALLAIMGMIYGVVWIILAAVMDTVIGFYLFRGSVEKNKIIEGIAEIRGGNLSYQIDMADMHGENELLAEAVNSIGEGIRSAVEVSMKDERLKADLITNVSHDIKTPLTSIINYVDLIKRQDIQDERIKGYVAVLDAKSQRLKQLTDDLVEASKISSGNIVLNFEKINIVELVNQAIGEFSEKFVQKDLSLMANFEDQIMYIEADSRRIWRVMENLFNNIYKYALEGTRVYIDGLRETREGNKQIVLVVKNISAQPLNINADELTERFIRGDVSRNTEGSGLGLSIAKNLTEAQHGDFDIYLDGDLFKVILTFPEMDS